MYVSQHAQSQRPPQSFLWMHPRSLLPMEQEYPLLKAQPLPDTLAPHNNLNPLLRPRLTDHPDPLESIALKALTKTSFKQFSSISKGATPHLKASMLSMLHLYPRLSSFIDRHPQGLQTKVLCRCAFKPAAYTTTSSFSRLHPTSIAAQAQVLCVTSSVPLLNILDGPYLLEHSCPLQRAALKASPRPPHHHFQTSFKQQGYLLLPPLEASMLHGGPHASEPSWAPPRPLNQGFVCVNPQIRLSSQQQVPPPRVKAPFKPMAAQSQCVCILSYGPVKTHTKETHPTIACPSPRPPLHPPPLSPPQGNGAQRAGRPDHPTRRPLLRGQGIGAREAEEPRPQVAVLRRGPSGNESPDTFAQQEPGRVRRRTARRLRPGSIENSVPACISLVIEIHT